MKLSHDLLVHAEEAAFAHKDVEWAWPPVASASLVRPIKRLTPLGVVKG